MNFVGNSEDVRRRMDAQTTKEFDWMLEQQVKLAFEVQGFDAFKSTRAEAAIHEAGHAVNFAATGQRVTECTISLEHLGAHRGWAGLTTGGDAWRIDQMTPVTEMLSIARNQLAGVTAERFALGRKARHGSSLDEVVFAQIIISRAATRLKTDGEALYHKQSEILVRVFEENRLVLDELAATLKTQKRLSGRRLDAILCRVQPMRAMV